MKKMSYSEALGEAIKIRMHEDPNILIFGEDVAVMEGTYGVSQGMLKEFGPLRVRDTPISESGFVGAAVGAAATGLRPIAEIYDGGFFNRLYGSLGKPGGKATVYVRRKHLGTHGSPDGLRHRFQRGGPTQPVFGVMGYPRSGSEGSLPCHTPGCPRTDAQRH